MSQEKILLLEDHPEISAALQLILGFEGYQVTHAATVRAAIANLTLSRFDLFLSDLNLPDGNSNDAISLARDQGIRSILFTGSVCRHQISEAVNSGALSLLVKPVDTKRLLGEIERLLSLPRLPPRKFRD